MSKFVDFPIDQAVVIWDVETTELIKPKVPIHLMSISVACAIVFDSRKEMSPNTVENGVRISFWNESVQAEFGLDDLCDLLATCKAHVAYNGTKFDMQTLKTKFESSAQEEDAIQRLHDPIVDIANVACYYSLNAILNANKLAQKSASGKEAPVMWKDGRLEDLESYCVCDVFLLAQLITSAPAIKVPHMEALVPLSISNVLFFK
jgi:hypothetical protein